MYRHSKILLIFTAVILFASSYPVKSYADFMDMVTHGPVRMDLLDFSDLKKWEAMRTSDVYEEQSRIVKEILTLNDPAKVLASLEWLNNNLKEDETYYVYPFMYALQLHRTKYVSDNPQAKMTALAMVYYSNLLLMTDAARCDDKGVGTSLMYSLSKELAPVKEATKPLSPDKKMTAMNIALFLEDKNRGRRKHPVICHSGAGYMARALQSKNTQTTEAIAKEGNYRGHLPGSKVVTIKGGDDVDVFFVSDEEWHKRRDEIRDMFSKLLDKEKE
jgi:hypothetical protein